MNLLTPTSMPAVRTAERWSAVGHASHADPRTAVAMAYGQLDLVDSPSLLIAFTAPTYDHDAIAAAIGDIAPGVPVIGCTAGGEISAAGALDDSVVIMALGGEGIRCSTASEPVVDGDARSAAGAAATRAAAVETLGHTVMVVLADGNGVDQDDFIRGAYDAVGASIPLVGGCACGEGMRDNPSLFHGPAGGRVDASGRSVVVAAITSTGPIGIGVGHGFDPDEEPHVVTSSGRNVVETLGERPALDAYLDHHGLSDDVFDGETGINGVSESRPLGVVRRGRVEPRAVIGADRAARTIMTGAPIPPGGLVWLMHTDVDAALDAIDTAAAQALDGLGGLPPRAVLAFDCAGRRGVLGVDRTVEEIERLVGAAGCPVAGLYTFGEIARTSGRSGFHNLTVVLLAFG